MRILLVDDSALARGIIRQALEDEGFVVAGQASNGEKAIELNRELEPDLIVMDINMPVMDGLTATRAIMADRPVPILIFSTEVDARTGFDTMKNGALDIMRKPGISEFNNPGFHEEFLSRIHTLAKSLPVSRAGKRNPAASALAPGERQTFSIAVMGTSTGGPVAVKQILDALPGDFPLPLLLVQHLEKGFDQSYADWLQEGTRLRVRLAQAGDIPRPGTVLVAPVGTHLRLDGNEVGLADTPPVLNQKPAVDVLFKSVAVSFGHRVLGILLTGMGSDGGEGCVAIRENGGYTLVQDAASSAIYGMPKVAAEMGGASEVLGLDLMASRMNQIAREGV